MSTLTNIHTFVPFNAKTSKPLDATQRLAKVTYKRTEKNPNPKASVCVSIPKLSLTGLDQGQVTAILPHIVGLLESAQDGIIKDRSEEGAISVTTEELSFTACVAWLDEAAQGNRLTGEQIAEWFNSTLADNLAVYFADKLGIGNEPTPEDEKRINQQLAIYRDSFAGLAGGKTVYTEAKANKMIGVLETFVDSSDAMGTKFNARLKAMIAKQQMEVDML